MTLEERSNLVLAVARVLYVNGQATGESVAAAERLGRTLGLCARIIPRWGELQLHTRDEHDALMCQAVADPSGVDMDRVASALRASEDVGTGRLAQHAGVEAIKVISQAPPAPTWLFTLAAGSGATALAVLFGIRHLPAASLVFLSAATGGLLRRLLARYSGNLFLQPFSAALLAGVVGALAVRYQLSSPLRLVAVSPCMILVPGPHVLNGGLDLLQGRIHLGAARLTYAGLVIAAISTGLLLGLALLGVSLPIDPGSRFVPLWQDMIAAGVAVACFSVFFSTPLHMLTWPVAVGMLAHGVRWAALTVLGSSAATGAFIACLIVGLVLTPVARRWHMPFAAVGFASVVSMMPGVFLFRMASGLMQLAARSHTTLELISGTVADGTTALTIILGMSLGLIVPKLAIDRLSQRSAGEEVRAKDCA